ncbi:cytochrome P460 family protein [Chitinophaga sp. MM2321]|uniref:cytochrome P460 family protein n=1 Tax=Chitinophaga sp. MM2321 TaxID=3137178 RepID=UPI0032D58609
MKKRVKIVVFLLIGIVLIQCWRPEKIESEPAKDLSDVPKEVSDILRNSCFDCHSNQTNLSWYDQLTPANFIVSGHIRDGRSVLNFSNWDSLKQPQRSALLYYAFNKILSGEMPLPAYSAIHRDAKLNKAAISTLKSYVTSLSLMRTALKEPLPISDKATANPPVTKTALDPKKVAPTANGINYIPDYRDWKAISTTDRFDNGTMRIIFGNSIAVKAIREHHTNPWPDGAIFAKTAWKQQVQPDGTVAAGDFVQVEFMIKDAKKYVATKGWGWARWKGDHLKPYGERAVFVQECISCHNPVKDNDYVFTAPLQLEINKSDTTTR